MMRRRALWSPGANSTLWTIQRFNAQLSSATNNKAGRLAEKAAVVEKYGAQVPAEAPPRQNLPLGHPNFYVVEPAKRPGSWKRFLKAGKDQYPLVLASCVFVGLYSLASLNIPHGLGVLLDHAQRGELPYQTSIRLFGWFTLAGVANYARLTLVGYAGETLIRNLRSKIYGSMLRQQAHFFDNPSHKTGALSQRLASDTTVVGSALTEALTNGTKNFCQVVGSLGIMVYLSPHLSGVVAVGVPLLVMFSGKFGKMIRNLQSKIQNETADLGGISEERLSNIRTVKAFVNEENEIRVYEKKLDTLLGKTKQQIHLNAAYVGLLHFSGYCFLYALLFAGSLLVANNSLTPGVLFSFMLYSTFSGIGMMGMAQLATDLNKGYGASLRIFDILDEAERMSAKKEQETEAGTGGKKIYPFKADIVLKDLQFAYPTRPDIMVYKGVNLRVEPGKCTCVVGASGSGKSTLASLILKFYEPNAGSLTVDGVDVNQLDTDWLRSRCAFVPQEPVLFSGTIAENIAYGIHNRDWDKPSIDKFTMQAIHLAADQANARDFINALPDGFETQCGQQGKSLSGGQKQRIAIARALIRDPQLLILDEATSALDAESEEVVQETIESVINKNREKKKNLGSVLMFAHRLSMIRNADHIVVMKDGVVVEEGSFAEVSQLPAFQSLVGLSSGVGTTEETSGSSGSGSGGDKTSKESTN